MRHQCILDTSGYELVFYLQSLDATKKCVGILVEFRLKPRHGNFSIRSGATTTYIAELEKLIMYLENHISALKNNPGNQFHVFVTYDFSFQIQALAGEVRSESEGEFTIQCMVNIGQPEEEGFSTYVGGEAVINLEKTKDFTLSLHTALNSFLEES